MNDKIDDSKMFFNELWSDADSKNTENVIIKSGRYKTSSALNRLNKKNGMDYYDGIVREIRKTRMRNINLFYTPNTFKPCGNKKGSNKKNRLFSIYCFAIDVDYIDIKKEEREYQKILRENTFGFNQNIISFCVKPKDYYSFISEQFEILGVPYPSFIECGHRLRLLYLLESPVNCSKQSNAIRAVERIQETICKKLNKEYECGAEPQLLSGYFRMPGSINSKDNSKIEIWLATGNKYCISELIEEYLPDLKYSPDEYKKINKQRKRRFTFDTEQLCKERLNIFNRLHEYAVMNNCREVLTFLYTATYLTINPRENSISIASEFNKMFSVPLPENEIRSSFRTTKSYKFTNKKIASMLNMDEEELYGYGISESIREKIRRERIKNGDMRWQKAEARYQEYIKLQATGMKRKEIAKMLNLSVETIKKYRKRLTKELGASDSPT